MTAEAALTKLMFALGNEEDLKKVKDLIAIPICGEMER